MFKILLAFFLLHSLALAKSFLSSNTPACASADEFKYPNGSCLSTCPSPFTAEVNKGAHFCSESKCVVDLHLNGSRTTNCQNQNGTCPPGYFVFADESCKKICPSGFDGFENATCTFPCDLSSSAFYPSGYCLDTCVAGYTPRVKDSFLICDKITGNNSTNNSTRSYFATARIHVRYSIPLKDFTAQGYLEKFVTQMAKLLGVKNSDIEILKIKEGSTIIESKVVVKSKSLADIKSIASEMNQKLNEATLEIEGISVLDKSVSVVISEEEQDTIDNDEELSSSEAIAIGIGVGLGAIGVCALAYSQYQKKLTSFQIDERIPIKVVQTPASSREETLKTGRGNLEINPFGLKYRIVNGKREMKYTIKEKLQEEVQVDNKGPLSVGEIMENID